jgi:hypothetical protein
MIRVDHELPDLRAMRLVRHPRDMQDHASNDLTGGRVSRDPHDVRARIDAGHQALPERAYGRALGPEVRS